MWTDVCFGQLYRRSRNHKVEIANGVFTYFQTHNQQVKKPPLWTIINYRNGRGYSGSACIFLLISSFSSALVIAVIYSKFDQYLSQVAVYACNTIPFIAVTVIHLPIWTHGSRAPLQRMTNQELRNDAHKNPRIQPHDKHTTNALSDTCVSLKHRLCKLKQKGLTTSLLSYCLN